MFDASDLILFVVAGLMLNLTPGPDMLYCASRAVGQGRAAGVLSALGSGAGGSVHILAAALGLSVLLTYSTVAFLIVKYAGAAYLVFLGLRMILSGGQNRSPVSLAKNSLPRIFLQGLTITVLNPKVALFFLSFLPQFVDPLRGSVTLQIIVLGLIFVVNGTIVLILVGLLFGQIGAWLDRWPRFWTIQRWATGSILVTLGGSLALSDRR